MHKITFLILILIHVSVFICFHTFLIKLPEMQLRGYFIYMFPIPIYSILQTSLYKMDKKGGTKGYYY